MKRITEVILGLTITALLAGGAFFSNVSGQTASLMNEKAVKHLRETGEYDSLRAAFNETRKRSGDEPQRPEENEIKLSASDGVAGDRFGNSVAISGDTAIVGSYEDDIGAINAQGSAYVFVRNGTTWTQQAKLIAPVGAEFDRFGYSVAISDDTVVVGVVGDNNGANFNQGSAYVFVRNGTTWTQQAKLTASPVTGGVLGWSVAVSGDTAIVGNPADNNAQGAAYIFVRNGTIWTQQTKLIAADGATEDGFGSEVAVSGDTAIVGSDRDDIGANVNQGAAYIYVRNGTIWTQQAKLTASDGSADDRFGYAVAISGETAIAGAVYDDTYKGAAYVFVRSGTTWAQQSKLIPTGYDFAFGHSVAISGNRAVVGSLFDDVGAGSPQGAANVFVRNSTTWARRARFTTLDGAAIGNYGWNVDISDDTVIAGSVFDIGANGNQGAAYVFNLVNTRPLYDFDGDGKADVSVFRPSDGMWYLNRSTQGFSATQFGLSADKITPADYDGDGKTDIAVFRDGTWYLLRSTTGFAAVQFGLPNDIPQPADFDGDGKDDIAVFRPSNGTWYLQRNQLGFTGVNFGQTGDKPVAADYDGDGKTDIAVYRDGFWYWQRSSDNGFGGGQFGNSTDKPVVGDYDGDSKADQAVYRDGTWYLLRSEAGFTAFQFGLSTDVPAPADYDGDGITDAAVYRDGTWYLRQTTNGFSAVQFGLTNDKPVPTAYLP